jgi:hypothetical protein|uniref:hypothetical protein n=1 Tax=Gelidibacter sp. TaxID=2018083 RepID=UPI004049D7F1
MKTLITILALFTASLSYAQYPPVTPDSGTTTYQAEQLTDKYNRQLALTGIQIPLFKEVVKKYIKLANEAKDQYEGKQELDMLLELQARETLQMNDILTQPQYRLYKELKPDYQPLKVVAPAKDE